MQVLREDPGSTGLVTSISGMITKHGMGLWSTDAAGQGLPDGRRQRAGARRNPNGRSRFRLSGPGGRRRLHGHLRRRRAEHRHRRRAGAQAGHPRTPSRRPVTRQLLADMVSNEWVGRRIDVTGDGFHRLRGGRRMSAETTQVIDARWAPHVEGARQANEALREMGDLIPDFDTPEQVAAMRGQSRRSFRELELAAAHGDRTIPGPAGDMRVRVAEAAGPSTGCGLSRHPRRRVLHGLAGDARPGERPAGPGHRHHRRQPGLPARSGAPVPGRPRRLPRRSGLADRQCRRRSSARRR